MYSLCIIFGRSGSGKALSQENCGPTTLGSPLTKNHHEEHRITSTAEITGFFGSRSITYYLGLLDQQILLHSNTNETSLDGNGSGSQPELNNLILIDQEKQCKMYPKVAKHGCELKMNLPDLNCLHLSGIKFVQKEKKINENLVQIATIQIYRRKMVIAAARLKSVEISSVTPATPHRIWVLVGPNPD
ncbi:hypothetical protein TNCV_2291131 [Trichonephila clavipes]|uniref:Uncharacterized protein n=1 Tax=Trichonephila clavipes TaxID=2585209 RepID=A0A8X6RTI9_TRICX|nr:hypothetical protein TNCV_2291131 [Trichonephila clavipes]